MGNELHIPTRTPRSCLGVTCTREGYLHACFDAINPVWHRPSAPAQIVARAPKIIPMATRAIAALANMVFSEVRLQPVRAFFP